MNAKLGFTFLYRKPFNFKIAIKSNCLQFPGLANQSLKEKKVKPITSLRPTSHSQSSVSFRRTFFLLSLFNFHFTDYVYLDIFCIIISCLVTFKRIAASQTKFESLPSWFSETPQASSLSHDQDWIFTYNVIGNHYMKRS